MFFILPQYVYSYMASQFCFSAFGANAKEKHFEDVPQLRHGSNNCSIYSSHPV